MSDEAPISLIPRGHPEGPWRSYKEKIAALSQRIVDAQRPIRVLNAIQWSPTVYQKFKDSRFRQMPRVDAEDYPNDLGFDAESKLAEFRDIQLAVLYELGHDDALGNILLQTAREYAEVVEMLRARGTARFYELSRKLYGSAKEIFPDGVTKIRDVALDMYEILSKLGDEVLGPQVPRSLNAEDAVVILNERLGQFFGDERVRVMVDDGIVADSAAGSDYVKLRRGARFSERDLRILEVHEGWAHVATSLNGQLQPVARWLSKGPPRTLATQEGLGALLEVLTFASHPSRARRLNDRVLAIDKAEDGASFVDVFEWFRTEGYDEEVCFSNTQRVFRGGVLEGKAPFTKDIVYTKGIVQNYDFLRTAIATGRTDLVRWLFVGKAAIEDIPVLASHAHEGVVQPPHYVPQLFRDLNGLAVWLSVSSFWGRLNFRALHKHYSRLIQGA